MTTTGCYGTGSSAVTDLVMEFDGVSCVSDNEIRILHDPDGVSDLEYNLIENPNRHNSSYFLKKFKKRMEDLDHIWFIPRFHRYFGDGFLDIVDTYIDKLTVMPYHGMWHYDVYDRGKLFYVLSRIEEKISTRAGRIFRFIPDAWGLVPKSEMQYLTITDEEKFLEATREFVDDMCTLIFKDKTDYVFMDQLIPPTNFKRYFRYVNDLRVILVERDPRDIFLMEKVVWGGGVAPTESINQYVEWFRWTRELYEKQDFPKEVMKLRFEDLIYRYDDTVVMIARHFGLTDLAHSKKKELFDPQKSVINTQLWKRIKGYEEEMKIIEKELPEYCYDFDVTSKVQQCERARMF